MSWPIGPDYNDAIQNPQANLRDPCLRRGKVVTTRLGLPAVDSGNFASVFQVLDGSQRWAVKCFTRQTRDQQERYRAISDQLKSRPLPFTVDFDYQPEGILVRGSWYPILRMQWIEGPLLDAYVRNNLKNKAALKQLADKWLACMNALQQSGMAHGDLQFGNIKIVGSDVRLIDYDGMYVPALKHKESSETGHQNFQHPRRTGKDFDQYIDNFPAWVIYTSLHALAEYPTIWTEADGGDDCLIFRKADFETPDSSRVFSRLEQAGSKQLKALLLRLKDYCRRPVQQVPPLQPLERRNTRTPGRATQPQRAPGKLPDWIPSSSVSGDEDIRPSSGDALRRALRGKELSNSQYIFVMAGILTVVGVLTGTGLAVPMPIVVSLVAAATTGATLLIDRQYHAFRRRVGVTQLETEIAALSKQLASLDSQKRSLDDRCMAITARVRGAETDVANHATQLTNAARHWDEKTAAVHNARDLALRELARKENDKLVQKQAEHRTKVAAITQQLSFLDMHRDARLGSRLHELRISFIDTALKDHELRDVRFEGLGETLSARLRAAGFHSAFDILASNPRAVSGIGTARAYALEAWARDIRARAEKAAPKQLPAQLKKEVVADFAQQKRRLEDDIASLERQLAQLTQASHQALASEQQGLIQRFRLEEDKVGRERYEWEQAARKRGQDLEASLQQHRSECMRVTEELASERERLHREDNAVAARRGDRLKQHETFRGLSFFSFFIAVARMT
jgi:hypothetical protein